MNELAINEKAAIIVKIVAMKSSEIIFLKNTQIITYITITSKKQR